MTKRKLTLIITASVLAAILIAVAACAIVAHGKDDKTAPSKELAVWQSMIKDDALLKDVVIAGAHDAGTKGLPYFAETQDRDTMQLLLCGTRYLDLRVAEDKGNLLIYHGPSKGVKLSEVLDDVVNFLLTYASESVILDFQHFSGDAQQGCLELVERKLGLNSANGMAVCNTSGLSDAEFADGLTMDNCRGKCIIFWGGDKADDYSASKNYVFKRNNDNGSRQNSVLHSFYQGSLNKKSSAYYVEKGLAHYLELYKTEQNVQHGLKVLQGQLTDGLYVLGPRFREATHTDRMNDYLDKLASSPNDLQYVNVVIRDFVSPYKNCRTLQLNLAKGTVKADKTAEFKKMIENNAD